MCGFEEHVCLKNIFTWIFFSHLSLISSSLFLSSFFPSFSFFPLVQAPWYRLEASRDDLRQLKEQPVGSFLVHNSKLEIGEQLAIKEGGGG